MTQAERKDFKFPDEVREFENGRLEIVNMTDGTVGRMTLNPGWRWSQHVKPLVNTEWCQTPHYQYQLSGKLHILMQDGTEFETAPGQVVSLPPGHDAWVVGDEPVVVIDWVGAINYAKK